MHVAMGEVLRISDTRFKNDNAHTHNSRLLLHLDDGRVCCLQHGGFVVTGMTQLSFTRSHLCMTVDAPWISAPRQNKTGKTLKAFPVLELTVLTFGGLCVLRAVGRLSVGVVLTVVEVVAEADESIQRELRRTQTCHRGLRHTVEIAEAIASEFRQNGREHAPSLHGRARR